MPRTVSSQDACTAAEQAEIQTCLSSMRARAAVLQVFEMMRVILLMHSTMALCPDRVCPTSRSRSVSRAAIVRLPIALMAPAAAALAAESESLAEPPSPCMDKCRGQCFREYGKSFTAETAADITTYCTSRCVDTCAEALGVVKGTPGYCRFFAEQTGLEGYDCG